MVTTQPRSRSAFARLLKHWRTTRRLSQLALALRVETTTRHLSYLENGRSRPGREWVLRAAEALDLPLRTRNELLVAAGFAPEFPAHDLSSVRLEPYRRAVFQLIEAIRPFPAFVLDPMFDLVEANAAGRRLLPDFAPGARINLIDAFLAPGPARALVQNFEEVAWSLHDRLLRSTALSESPEANALRARVAAYLREVPRPLADAAGDPVMCPTFAIGGVTVRTIGMTMRFGPSRDVTLEELSVDVLYPRDAEATRFFQLLENAP
jgi:transcriptional regulator with XRE-family HTH domain